MDKRIETVVVLEVEAGGRGGQEHIRPHACRAGGPGPGP